MSDHVRVGQVKEITSLANPLVKDIKALALKKFRDQQNAFMAEGLKLVIDALDLGWPIRTLVFAKAALGNAGGRKGGGAHRCAPAARCSKSRKRCLAPSPAATIRRWWSAFSRSKCLAAEGHPRRPAAMSGWRSTGCAIPAISAPSSAPPTPSAPRASSWSARPPIRFRWRRCAPPWDRSSQCRVRARHRRGVPRLARQISGPGRRHASQGRGRLPLASTMPAGRCCC